MTFQVHSLLVSPPNKLFKIIWLKCWLVYNLFDLLKTFSGTIRFDLLRSLISASTFVIIRYYRQSKMMTNAFYIRPELWQTTFLTFAMRKCFSFLTFIFHLITFIFYFITQIFYGVHLSPQPFLPCSLHCPLLRFNTFSFLHCKHYISNTCLL